MASDGNTSTISTNSALPTDILEGILSKLPLASIIRARLVCKSWNRLLRSAPFLHKLSASPPSPRKSWWNLSSLSSTLKPFPPYYSNVAFSPGLVCLMARKVNGLEFCVCNPITRLRRKLPDLPYRGRVYKRVAPSMSAGRVPGTYIIVVVTTMEGIDPHVGEGTELGIHVYSSEKLAWETREDLFLPIDYKSMPQSCVIREVLYFQCTNYAGKFVCAYDLSSGLSLDISSFEKDLIPLPCTDECSVVMNMRGRVAMLGLSNESMKVRLLDDKEWVEVASMPQEYFKGMDIHLRRLSIRLSCISGFDEVIYIPDPWPKRLVIFDMATRSWRWIEGLAYLAKGTYFEPRFDAIP